MYVNISHRSLDEDDAVKRELRNIAETLVNTVMLQRHGGLERLDTELSWPRHK